MGKRRGEGGGEGERQLALLVRDKSRRSAGNRGDGYE